MGFGSLSSFFAGYFCLGFEVLWPKPRNPATTAADTLMVVSVLGFVVCVGFRGFRAGLRGFSAELCGFCAGLRGFPAGLRGGTQP